MGDWFRRLLAFEYYQLNPDRYFYIVNEKGNPFLECKSDFVDCFENYDWRFDIDSPVKKED